MLDDHGADLAHYVISNEYQTSRLSRLGQCLFPGYRPEGAAHAEVDVQHHCRIALPKEVEQILAMHLDARQQLLIDGLSACMYTMMLPK